MSWLDRCFDARDRILADPRFQHWAAKFPLTRPIARRRTRALFDLCAGFVYSQVLLACVRLKLFEILAEGPQPLTCLSRRMSLSNEAARRLLDAAVSLDLVSRRGTDVFALGPLGAAMVGNPGIAAMVEHHVMLYSDLEDPVALLRGAGKETALGGYWPYAANSRQAALSVEQTAAYTELMSLSQPMIAREVLDSYSLRGHRSLLDVGGGNGAFLSAAAEQAPNLRLMLFDLPSVAQSAEERLTRLGLSQRTEVFGGNFLIDSLPRGADVISLVRVIHDHDDDSALRILQAARRALPDDGILLLAEPMSETAGAEPAGAAYFGFYLLAMGRGRPRTPAELKELLRIGGFAQSRLLPSSTPLLTRVMIASV